MKLAAQPIPAPILGANNGRGPISMKLEYQGPKTLATNLGCIPDDVSTARYDGPDFALYSRSSHQPLGGGRQIVREQPVLDAAGKPVMETKVAVLEGKPMSIAGNTAACATAGAVVGLIVGGLGSVCMHSWLPAATLTLLGAGAGANYGHHQASDDRVRVEWKENSIDSRKLTGFSSSHSSVSHRTSYSPDFETTSHGTYLAPEIVHYKASTGLAYNPYTEDCGPL